MITKFIEFEVDGQLIKRKDIMQRIVADSKNHYGIKFDFSSEWAGLNKTAVITTGNETYNAMIADDIVLSQNMPILLEGPATFSVFGGDLYTANEVTIMVEKSGKKPGEAPPEPTPDIYTQLLDSVVAERKLAQEAKTESENQAGVAQAQADKAKEISDAMETSKNEFNDNIPVITQKMVDDVSAAGQEKVEEATVQVALAAEQAEESGKQAVISGGYAGDSLAYSNEASIHEEAAEKAKDDTAILKSQTEQVKSDTESLKNDCVGIKNVITAMISDIPTKYMAESIEVMQAITTMKHGDVCEIINSNLGFTSIYKYFTKDKNGNPLQTPTWAWMTDLSIKTLSKEYLMSILDLAAIADTGSYNDLTDVPNRYDSVTIVTNGNWVYSDNASFAKMIITGPTTLNITGAYNGCFGVIKIYGDYPVTLPANSLKLPDDWNSCSITTGSHWVYSFDYDGTNFSWGRKPEYDATI